MSNAEELYNEGFEITVLKALRNKFFRNSIRRKHFENIYIDKGWKLELREYNDITKNYRYIFSKIKKVGADYAST